MRTMHMILVAVSLAVTPAVAQDAPPDTRHDMMEMMHGQGGTMGMMGEGVMEMDAGPTMILKLRESLELSDGQVQRLMAIQTTAQAAMQQHMMEGMHAMQAAEKLLGVASPDLKAYEAAMRDAANHMVLAHTGMARVGLEARQVLSAQQRDRLALARKMMKEMQNGGEKGGMMRESAKKDGSM